MIRPNSPSIFTTTCLAALLLGSGNVLYAQSAVVDPASTHTPLYERHEGMGTTLEDFFVAAMDYSPALKIAEERMSIGDSRRRAATGQLLPQVSATANLSDNRQRQVEGLSTYRGERYALQMRQVLFNWAAFKERSAAQLEEDQFEAEYFEQLATLLTDIATKYFAVLQAQDALRFNQAELEAVSLQDEQVQSMYDRQMIQVTDLYEVRARLAEVRAEEELLSSELILAQETLRSATGLAVGPLDQLADVPELPAIEGQVDSWVAQARLNNHLVRAQELAVDIADQRLSQQRSVYMPTVSLVAQQQRSDLGYDNRASPRTDTGYVAIDVTVPLFAGGANRASVREASSHRSIASNELRQTQLDVSEQTRLTYLTLMSLERRIRAAEQVLESRQLSATAQQRGFELGTVTAVDVLQSTRDAFMAARDLQVYRYQYLNTSLALRHYAGTLTADDLLSISETLVSPGE